MISVGIIDEAAHCDRHRDTSGTTSFLAGLADNILY